jgi:glutamate racemase
MSFSKKQVRPIGVFDSGIGGLSVLKEIISLLPNENILYYADSANCPYGSRPKGQIIKLVTPVIDFLISQHCKMIVIACNTATAAAIDYLRKTYDIIFVGMEPAVKPAAMKSISGHVGILATEGTFRGKLFRETSGKYAKGIELHIQAGKGLVELVEANKADTDEAEALLRKYIEPMLLSGIDRLVLGCTHYPFMINRIKKITGDKVTIDDPSFAVAKRTKDLLTVQQLLNSGNEKLPYKFFINGCPEILEIMLDQITAAKYSIEKSPLKMFF